MINYHLSINMAITLDGKTARPDGKWYGLCSPTDRTRMDELRAGADCVIIGKNSVIFDDPVVKLKYFQGNDPRPVMIVRSSGLPADRHIFKDFTDIKDRPLVFCTRSNMELMKESLSQKAEIVSLGNDDIEPEDVIAYLSENGMKNILLEGGPRLNHAFLSRNLVHRINLTIVPYIIGQRTLPAFVDGDLPFSQFDQQKWNLVQSRQIENELFLIYDKID